MILRVIDDKFIDEYIHNHRYNLGKTNVGGTDWRFVDLVAPSFKQILEITNAKSILEIGFNMGGSALMFLSINSKLIYDSIDIIDNPKSRKFLSSKYKFWRFILHDSKFIEPGGVLFYDYDLVVVDGDHSKEGVIADINSSLKFNPRYMLFDDVKHPSHKYIEEIIKVDYRDKLDIVELYEFNYIWDGYSMALCKVK